MQIYNVRWSRVLFFYLMLGAATLLSVGVVSTVENRQFSPAEYVYVQYYADGLVGLWVVKLRSDYEILPLGVGTKAFTTGGRDETDSDIKVTVPFIPVH